MNKWLSVYLCVISGVKYFPLQSADLLHSFRSTSHQLDCSLRLHDKYRKKKKKRGEKIQWRKNHSERGREGSGDGKIEMMK